MLFSSILDKQISDHDIKAAVDIRQERRFVELYFAAEKGSLSDVILGCVTKQMDMSSEGSEQPNPDKRHNHY